VAKKRPLDDPHIPDPLKHGGCCWARTDDGATISCPPLTRDLSHEVELIVAVQSDVDSVGTLKVAIGNPAWRQPHTSRCIKI